MSNTTEITVGGFDPDRSLIELYIPRKGKGAAVSGDAPLTIVHEFGHAVQIMTGNKYGESKMQSEWKAMNGDHTYRASNIESNPSETTFVSGYAATDFAEDFAETFAHAFVCNRSGLGITGKLTSNGASTNLGKKFNYVYTIISTYFPQATTALENFQKLYSTSTSLTYGGVKLSGSYLQFIGYSEPRYLPLTVLDMFPEVRESQYKWIKEIGGWFATREGKDNLIVFPGGNWGTTSSTLS